MNTKLLKLEISNLLTLVEITLGKTSLSYQNLDYYFDILVTVYENAYDSDKDLLDNLKNLLSRLTDEIPELKAGQFRENYPNVDKMIRQLDKNLTD